MSTPLARRVEKASRPSKASIHISVSQRKMRHGRVDAQTKNTVQTAKPKLGGDPILSVMSIAAHALGELETVRVFPFRVLFETIAAYEMAMANRDDAFLEDMSRAIDSAFPDTYDIQEESMVEVSRQSFLRTDGESPVIHFMVSKRHQLVETLAGLSTSTWERERDGRAAFGAVESLDADVPKCNARVLAEETKSADDEDDLVSEDSDEDLINDENDEDDEDELAAMASDESDGEDDYERLLRLVDGNNENK